MNKYKNDANLLAVYAVYMNVTNKNKFMQPIPDGSF